MNNFESFYHGLVVSKIWLCENLEPLIIDDLPNVYVLGGWHNLMSFIMAVRNPHGYKEFHSFDLDPEAIDVANKICDTWKFEKPHIYNHVKDIEELDFSGVFDSVIINCSMDQMQNNDWYDRVPKNNLICVQTTDCNPNDVPWEIKQHTKDLSELKSKYSNMQVLYEGTKRIQYETFGYNRLMIIGKKL